MGIIIGKLELQSEEYQFQFDDFFLQIYKTEPGDIEDWEVVIESIVEEPKHELPETILGTCYPDGHRILFMQISLAGYHNNVKRYRVGSYFEIKPDFNAVWPISQITLSADEMDYIYPPSLMYSYTLDNKGIITKMNFKEPKESFEWSFRLENQSITASSGYSHSYRWSANPVQIHSMLYFDFEPTEDYEFVLHVFDIGNRLIQYLCFRQNVNCTDAGIYARDENGKHIRIGTLNAKWLCDQLPESDEKVLKKGIPYTMIGDSMGKILQRLSDDNLYCQHIPYNSKDERRITPSRTIMLTAAFEWEYSQLYLNGKRAPKGDDLKKRLVKALTDHADCLEIFAKHLYALNQLQYSVDTVAEKIKSARNAFAHGDIAMHYDLETYLGIAIMPYLIYVMQLKSAGVSNDKIKRCINALFGLHVL